MALKCNISISYFFEIKLRILHVVTIALNWWLNMSCVTRTYPPLIGLKIHVPIDSDQFCLLTISYPASHVPILSLVTRTKRIPKSRIVDSNCRPDSIRSSNNIPTSNIHDNDIPATVCVCVYVWIHSAASCAHCTLGHITHRRKIWLVMRAIWYVYRRHHYIRAVRQSQKGSINHSGNGFSSNNLKRDIRAFLFSRWMQLHQCSTLLSNATNVNRKTINYHHTSSGVIV